MRFTETFNETLTKFVLFVKDAGTSLVLVSLELHRPNSAADVFSFVYNDISVVPQSIAEEETGCASAYPAADYTYKR